MSVASAAQETVLLTLSQMSRLKRVCFIGHFPSKLQLYLTVHKQGCKCYTPRQTQRRRSSMTFLYLWQHRRGFRACGAPFETMHTS